MLTRTNQTFYKVTGKIKCHKWERMFAVTAQNTEYTNRNLQYLFWQCVYFIFYVWVLCLCNGYCNSCMPSGYGGQTKNSIRSPGNGVDRWFLLAMWIVGIKFGSSASMIDAFDLQAISSAPRPFVL